MFGLTGKASDNEVTEESEAVLATLSARVGVDSTGKGAELDSSGSFIFLFMQPLEQR